LRTITAGVDNAFFPNPVHVLPARLRIRQPGSGAKYPGQNVEFWSHQGEAMVKWGVDGEEFKCKLDAANPGGT